MKGEHMQLKAVRAGKTQGYLTVVIQDGEDRRTLTVSERDYLEASSPRPGDDLDGDMLAALSHSDELYRARLYALRILSYADNNERTLVRKLISRGISYAIAVDIAHEMVGRGYIDERRQLERLVITEVNRNLIGPHRIKEKLRAKGYSASDIDEMIEQLLDSGEIDFDRSAELLIAKKLTRGATDDEIKKLLYKNGYNA
jgi:regulatory protein